MKSSATKLTPDALRRTDARYADRSGLVVAQTDSADVKQRQQSYCPLRENHLRVATWFEAAGAPATTETWSWINSD